MRLKSKDWAVNGGSLNADWGAHVWVIWPRRKGVGSVQAELSEQCLGAGLTAMGQPAPTPHDRPSCKRGGL